MVIWFQIEIWKKNNFDFDELGCPHPLPNFILGGRVSFDYRSFYRIITILMMNNL